MLGMWCSCTISNVGGKILKKGAIPCMAPFLFTWGLQIFPRNG